MVVYETKKILKELFLLAQLEVSKYKSREAHNKETLFPIDNSIASYLFSIAIGRIATIHLSNRSVPWIANS